MLNHTHQQWLAAYLYYAEPWQELLVNAVYPFVEQVFAQGLAQQFFFIRYWQNGAHIRLRFKGEPDCLQHNLKPFIVSFFGRYFSQNPSRRMPLARNTAANYGVQADSIHFAAYEPEVARYGGPKGILIAERQFQLSSEIVLALMRESENWAYERALGAAIQLHLGFAWALGMNLNEARHFFAHIAHDWLFKASQVVGHEDEQASRVTTMNIFAENFERQKESLTQYHEVVWRAFAEGASFAQTWLNQWLHGLRFVQADLKRLQHEQQLYIPDHCQPSPAIPVPEASQQLWFIWGSYVHMTNNRLGILNHDEAFLGYLLKRCLENLAGREDA